MQHKWKGQMWRCLLVTPLQQLGGGRNRWSPADCAQASLSACTYHTQTNSYIHWKPLIPPSVCMLSLKKSLSYHMTYLVLLWHFMRVYCHSLFRFIPCTCIIFSPRHTPKGPTPLALLPLGSVTSCVADYSNVCQPSAFHPQSSCAALRHPCQHRAWSDVFTLDCGREWQWRVLPWWQICGSSFCVLVELKLLESPMSAGHGLHAWSMC